MKRIVSGIMLTLLMISMLTLAFNIQPVKASETIYIRADGRVDPSTAPISTFDNITYTFTDNIYNEIVVERSNILVNGNGFILQGSGSGDGFRVWSQNNVTIKNVNIKSFFLGISFSSSSNSSISGSEITNNEYGILLEFSSNNNICGNNVTNNESEGIMLSDSSNNSIAGNNITHNGYDIYGDGLSLVDSSKNNNISGNKITANNDHGIALADSLNNCINGNDIANNRWGIRLDSSSNNSVSGNQITSHWFGIIIFYSSNYNSIVGNNITNNYNDGIELWSSSNNSIVGNNITANAWNGISLVSSSNYNNVTGNNIVTNQDCGINLNSSSNNRITINHIAYNYWGFWLGSSSNNSITKNSIAYNFHSIGLSLSTNNRIFHNNFIENTHLAFNNSSSYNNFWDDYYLSGGNYWSDYAGVDVKSGPSQNLPGSDGIGDTPYIIDANNQDHYPLMTPWVERKVGVQVGDWTLYHMNTVYSTNDPHPPLQRPPSEIFEIEQCKFFVQNVHNTNVTFQFTTYYKDHTEKTTEWFIDVNTGEGIPMFLIGANLTRGDSIYARHWTEMKINETIPRMYLDAIRETNNISLKSFDYHAPYEVNASADIFWDRATGFITEFMDETSFVDETRNYTTYYSSSIKVIATNLWGAPPSEAYDIAIVSVVPFATEVYVGQTVNITVTVQNQGNFTETFNVTCKYELEGTEHVIGTETVNNLAPQASTSIVFSWTTTDVTVHTITAYATPVPNETDTADNNMTSPTTVKVKMQGDINGDEIIDIFDIVIWANAFGSKTGDSNWNPQTDLYQDSIIDIFDGIIIAINFGKTT